MNPTAWVFRAATWLAGVTVLAVYVAALSMMPKGVFWHPDEGGKYLTLRSIKPGFTYVVPYPGRSIDPQLQFYPGRCGFGVIYPSPQADGDVLFHWPIAFPLLSRPFLERWGMVGLYVIPLVSGWLTALLAGVWAGAYDRRLAPWAVLIAGLATPLLFYSISFSEYTFVTLVGAVAISMACRAAPGQRSAWVIVGCLLVVAVLLRVEMLACAASVGAVSIWSAWRQRSNSPARRAPAPSRLLITILAGVLGAGVLFLLLPERYQGLIRGTLDRTLLAKLPYLLRGIIWVFMGAPVDGPITGGVWESIALIGIAAAAAAALVRSQTLREWLFLGAVTVLGGLSLLALRSLPYLSRPGVLALSPYLIVGFLVLPEAWRRRDEYLVRLVATFALYAVFGFLGVFATRVSGQGAYVIGLDGAARYVVGLYPLGAALTPISLAVVWRSRWHPPARAALAVLVVAMVIVSGAYEMRGLQMVRARRQTLTAWQGALEQQGPVVTDVWWLAADLAPFFATHEMFCTRSAPAVSDWIETAAGRGVRTFTLATQTPVDLERLGPHTWRLELTAEQAVDGLYVYRFRLLDNG